MAHLEDDDQGRWSKWGTAVLGLLAITWIVLPRNNAAKVVEELGRSMSGMVNAATGIRRHDPSAVAEYQALPADLQKSIWEMLDPADQLWVEAVMAGTEM